MYYITFFVLSPFCIKPLLVRLDYSMHIIGVLSALGYKMFNIKKKNMDNMGRWIIIHNNNDRFVYSRNK